VLLFYHSNQKIIIMKHILLIEDDKLLSKSLEKYLVNKSYRVSLSEDGEEGLRKAEEAKPDLILLDIGMPKINGFHVLESLRSHPVLSSVPVIVISNSGEPVEIKKTQQLGAKDFIVKAKLSLTEIGRKIERIMSGADSGQEASDGNDFLKKEESSPAGNKENSSGAKGNRVLLVEDDSFFADLCIRGLEKRGFIVSVARNGEEGLKKLKEGEYDVALLDIIMPKMNGFEMLRNLRKEKNPKLANMPVIMLTNLYQKEDVEKAKQLKANAYLVKATTDISEVEDKINQALGK